MVKLLPPFCPRPEFSLTDIHLRLSYVQVLQPRKWKSSIFTLICYDSLAPHRSAQCLFIHFTVVVRRWISSVTAGVLPPVIADESDRRQADGKMCLRRKWFSNESVSSRQRKDAVVVVVFVMHFRAEWWPETKCGGVSFHVHVMFIGCAMCHWLTLSVVSMVLPWLKLKIE